ncbi:sulfite exporter TauE/SafE family protein [Croceicoccus marinus]|uniref:sulfite exporter TauE/SafE family protein n=1 Tax=Croceicoccus marinus TaxID=450378 RepID=UPI001FD01A41|nr:sulfite exporter TauE/SafE family protein [Croceicoccus marinus]
MLAQLAISLLPYLALLAAGLGAGFAGGLFGIGGGFVVVPALTLILPMLGTSPQQVMHVAIGTSLATIIFTSLRSVQSHARRGAVDVPFIKGWAPWLVVGTILGTLIADRVSSSTLALIFGIGVLVFAAYFLLPIRPERQPISDTMPTGAKRIGLAGFLGLISALLGIGGGTITTLTMTSCGAPIHRAIGTASGVGAIIALPAAIGFAITGFGEAGLPRLSIGYISMPAAIAIIATAVIAAPLGVAAAHRLSPALLRRVFGSYLVVVGITMITKA